MCRTAQWTAKCKSADAYQELKETVPAITHHGIVLHNFRFRFHDGFFFFYNLFHLIYSLLILRRRILGTFAWSFSGWLKLFPVKFILTCPKPQPKCVIERTISVGYDQKWYGLGEQNCGTKSGRWCTNSDNIKFTNVEAAERLDYCVRITYRELTFRSKRCVDVKREDNFGARKNPSELVGVLIATVCSCDCDWVFLLRPWPKSCE